MFLHSALKSVCLMSEKRRGLERNLFNIPFILTRYTIYCQRGLSSSCFIRSLYVTNELYLNLDLSTEEVVRSLRDVQDCQSHYSGCPIW